MQLEGFESDVTTFLHELAPARACLAVPTRPCGVRPGKPAADWPFETLAEVKDAPVHTAEELRAVLAVHPIREEAAQAEVVAELIASGAIARNGLFLVRSISTGVRESIAR